MNILSTLVLLISALIYTTVNSLPPSYFNVPAYARPATNQEIPNTENEYDDDLSGDFESVEDEKKDKTKNIAIWKLNLNQTKADKYIVQADIRLDHYQYEENLLQKLRRGIDENFPVTRTRRAARTGYLWKNNTIYYKIDSGFRRSTKMEIKRGIKHWKKTMKNCLKFVRLDRDPNLEKRIRREHFGGGPVEHILFKRTNTGCWSQVGRTDTRLSDRQYQQGQQLISIGDGCGEKGTVIHEVGHAIGFWHEQSRRDRDGFVKIVKSNIITNQIDQFNRMTKRQTTSMGYAYDFWSVMHYGPTFFSNNGRPTIKIIKKYRDLKPKIGQRKGLSYLDIAQVRAMYKCNPIPSLESRQTCVKKSTKGREYRGTLDYTESGVMCQPWNKQYPHSHKFDFKSKREGLGKHNYCRNPLGSKHRPWCYTTKSKLEWEYCDLQYCDR